MIGTILLIISSNQLEPIFFPNLCSSVCYSYIWITLTLERSLWSLELVFRCRDVTFQALAKRLKLTIMSFMLLLTIFKSSLNYITTFCLRQLEFLKTKTKVFSHQSGHSADAPRDLSQSYITLKNLIFLSLFFCFYRKRFWRRHHDLSWRSFCLVHVYSPRFGCKLKSMSSSLLFYTHYFFSRISHFVVVVNPSNKTDMVLGQGRKQR